MENKTKWYLAFWKGFRKSLQGKERGGFTLVELLVVISICFVLAAISFPAYSSYRGKGMIAHARVELKNMQLALEMLAMDTYSWPGPNPVGEMADAEVWDLNADNAGLIANDGSFPNWQGPYLQPIGKDPWGNDYFFDPDYLLDGKTVAVLGSFGPNGLGPNQYDTDNIVQVLPAS